MNNDLLAKFIYGLTILYSIKLFFVAFANRKKNRFINNLFVIYCVMVPLYIVLAIFYMAEFSYNDAISYFLWAVVNILFLVTDMMLLNYLVEHNQELKK